MNSKKFFMIKEKLNIIKENPVLILAAAYPYMLVVLVAIGFFYINNSGTIAVNKIKAKLPDTSQVVNDFPIQQPRISAGVDIKLIQNGQSLLDKGKQLYTTTCSSCHGTEGKGDGVAGASLNPQPRNFHSNDGWKNGNKFSQIYLTLQKGIPGTGMSAYDFIPVEDRLAIIHFVRTFMQNPPAIENSEVAELDKTYGLSTGVKIAGTMPLANSEKIFINSNALITEKINQAIAKINQLKNQNAGAEIFEKITVDKYKALTTLNNSNWQNSAKDFLLITQSNLYQNGFNGKLLSVTNDELNLLFQFLKEIFA